MLEIIAHTFFIMKIPNNLWELLQIAINHSADINTKDFIEISRKCTDKPYSFLVIDTTLQLIFWDLEKILI